MGKTLKSRVPDIIRYDDKKIMLLLIKFRCDMPIEAKMCTINAASV